MFTDIVGYTARTSAESRAANEALLKTHDRLLLPIVARYGGRRIKSIGDALLVVFESPTEAVRCAMALQDAVFAHNTESEAAARFHIRVAINTGEVRVLRGDVFGEAINIAARIEALTPPDEIYFGESVYLAMNKAEVTAEVVGVHELKGIPEPVRVYRAPPAREGAPFGGRHEAPRRPPLVELAHLRERLPRRALATAAIVLLSIFLAAQLFGASPLDEARRDLLEGRLDAAERRARAVQAEDPRGDEGAAASLLLGHVAFARAERKRGIELYAEALSLDDDLAGDTHLIKNLVESLGAHGKPSAELLVRHPTKEAIAALAARAAEPGFFGRRRAIEVLRRTQNEDAYDKIAAATRDLEDAPECAQRREAVTVLRAAKAVGALPALRKLASDDFKNRFYNHCLLEDARRAIKELEGT